MDDTTRQCIEIVNVLPEADYKIDVRRDGKYLERLPGAGSLARILLSDAAVGRHVDAYEKADKTAGLNQALWKGAATVLGVLLVAIAIVFVAGFFVNAVFSLIDFSRGNLIILQLVIGALAVAAIAFAFVSFRRPYRRWIEARRDAEAHRRKLFEAILAAETEDGAGALPVLPLKLEYILKAHIDVQKAYFEGRGAEHARSTRWVAWVKGIGWLLIGVCVAAMALIGFAGMSEQGGQETLPEFVHDAFGFVLLFEAWRLDWLLVMLVLVLTALMVLLYVLPRLIDRRDVHSARYAIYHTKLSEIDAAYRGAARQAAASGNKAEVQKIFDVWFDLLDEEHQAWLKIQS